MLLYDTWSDTSPATLRLDDSDSPDVHCSVRAVKVRAPTSTASISISNRVFKKSHWRVPHAMASL